MAIKKDRVIFNKEITLTHIISTAIIIVSMFWFTAKQDKRIALLESTSTYQDRVIGTMGKSLISIDKKMGVLISKFEFERGKNAANHSDESS